MLDPNSIRRDFPIYESQPALVYLDSAATALKPRPIVDAMNAYYFEYSANASRGLYPLAERATYALDEARRTVARFVHAESKETVIFTANATHGINLVALGLEHRVKNGENIVITELEHHSNLLPWKELAKRTGAELRTARFTDTGQINTEHLMTLIDTHTTIVAFSAVSNVFGVINPVAHLIQTIRNINPHTYILIDACQAAGHIPIELKQWDADFIVFSGHKLFGPTGIGILTGKHASLATLRPMNVGGGTVLDACSTQIEYKMLPENLEGGTPNIAGAIGLASAIDFVESIGLENIHAHEVALTEYTLGKLRDTFGEALHILGTTVEGHRTGILSFTLDGLHPHDLAHLLGEEGICVRAGEHCASPLHQTLHLSATTRLSLSIYNTETDIDQFVATTQKIHALLTL